MDNLVKEYHASNLLLFKNKLGQQERFNALRREIWIVLREAPGNHEYIGFVDHWNSHIAQMVEDHKMVTNYIARPPSQPKKEPSTKKNELDEDDIRPKKKKLSESEKAMLLGDLKSFSKNFKFPA